MNNHEQTPQPEVTSLIIDLLQQLIRAHYAHTAQSSDSSGEVHEAVADVLMKACHSYEPASHTERTTSAREAEIESSLTAAMQSMMPTTPEYNAIDLVRSQIRSMRS